MKYAAHHFRIPLAVLGIALLLPSPLAPKDNKQQEAEALLAKARELSDIRCEGCPPFRLEAQIEILGEKGTPIVVKYTETWVSPRQRRIEEQFEWKRVVYLYQGETTWIHGEYQFHAWEMFLSHESLMFPGRLRIRSDEERFEDLNHRCAEPDATCVSLRHNAGALRKVYLDPLRHVPAREEHAGAYEFSDYKSLGKKTFPQMIKISWRGKRVGEIRVTRLSTADDFDPALFRPPGNDKGWLSITDARKD